MRTSNRKQLLASVKWESLLRYRLIEIVSLWEGHLTTRHLMTTFGIKRQQASRDINAYKAIAPGNIEYLPARKGYAPARRFKPFFTEGTVDEYLNLVDSRGFMGSVTHRIAIPDAHTHILRSPPRLAQPAIVRPMVDACRRGQRLEITYASMSSPEGEERIIAPHAVVSSGYRWHVRAYCEKNRDYRDFLLGRVLEIAGDLGAALEDPINDSKWHTEITLRLIPHPALSKQQQKLVRYERCFDGEVLELKTREATAIYLLHMLQIPAYKSGNFRANPLVLEDPDVVRHLRF
jgi:predicted DNA-binding transcriptional regulator YafY